MSDAPDAIAPSDADEAEALPAQVDHNQTATLEHKQKVCPKFLINKYCWLVSSPLFRDLTADTSAVNVTVKEKVTAMTILQLSATYL